VSNAADAVLPGYGPVEFVSVAVAGSPPVDFCVDPSAADPVAGWFLDHDWIDEPVQRAFLQFVGPGMRVVDLGCHLGTFSLPAARLGAEVLAVDAAPEHVALLGRAAERNGFDLRVVHGAVADDAGGSGFARFVVRSVHGHLHTPGEGDEGVVEVPVVVIDDLLDELGWESVDAMKLDIEGAEVAALQGMRRLFAGGSRPAIVIECNATMLRLQGVTTVDLRQMLADLGYQLFLIDHLRPGTLVEIEPDTVQTESASDLLAVVVRPDDLGLRWTIEPGLSREATVARLLNAAASPAAGYRRHSADVLAHGPAWLRNDPAVAPALAALGNDVAAEVRAALARPGPGAVGPGYAHVSEPPSGGPPPGTLAFAEGASLHLPGSGLEQPPTGEGPVAAELVLADLSFHVAAGESVAILSEDPLASNLLLRALSGTFPHLGSLRIGGRPVLLVDIGQAFEPGLSVAENVVLLGAHLGCHTGELEAKLGELLDRAGAREGHQAPLSDHGAEVAARIALTVVLECASPQLLLVDLPRIEDPTFAAWVRDRIAQLRSGGMAVVQSVRDPSELLSPATRAMWLRDARLWAFGHAESIFEADRRERLGLGPAVGPERPTPHSRR